jgi:hypothetical protein
MKCARVKNLTMDTKKKPHKSYFGLLGCGLFELQEETYGLDSQEEQSQIHRRRGTSLE